MNEYPFPDTQDGTLEYCGYNVFPAFLENDPNIFFHGTSATSLEAILKSGFQMPPKGKAQSASFATTSAVPLCYASEARSLSSPRGGIIAVRYADLGRAGLGMSGDVLHDCTLQEQPEIVGFCFVPSDYAHR